MTTGSFERFCRTTLWGYFSNSTLNTEQTEVQLLQVVLSNSSKFTAKQLVGNGLRCFNSRPSFSQKQCSEQ